MLLIILLLCAIVRFVSQVLLVFRYFLVLCWRLWPSSTGSGGIDAMRAQHEAIVGAVERVAEPSSMVVSVLRLKRR